jgi:hypothetical protein
MTQTRTRKAAVRATFAGPPARRLVQIGGL